MRVTSKLLKFQWTKNVVHENARASVTARRAATGMKNVTAADFHLYRFFGGNT